jgi:hypothetical protein
MKLSSMKVGMRVAAVTGAEYQTGIIRKFVGNLVKVEYNPDGDYGVFHRRQLVPLVKRKRKRREWKGEWSWHSSLGRWIFVSELTDQVDGQVYRGLQMTLREVKQKGEAK